MFSYVLSVCLSIVGTRMGSSLIQKMTSESQDQKVQMTTYLNFAWDNIIIGNAWNYLLWKNKLKSSLQDTGLKQTRLVLSVEVLSGITTIASLTPVIASVVYLLLWKSDWTMAAVLVATLPRQIQTIQNISTMVQMSFQWASVRSRLDCLNESVRIDATKVLYGTIDWSQLKIHKDMEVLHLSRIEDFMKNLELPGRITISGKNGCGKSTLLSQVKEQLQERAVYLPPHSDLYFNSTQNQNLSTGTKILYAFDEIQKNIKNAVFIA
jgi:ABC-type bacteriocin/lantibiotic exporter with double-glycine peptidase domain